MASYPPPPDPRMPPLPYTSLNSPGYAPTARELRAIARAQRDLSKAQRRAQNLDMRRSSILGPLLILSIGIVLLLIRLGRISAGTAAEWFSQWWPLLFVVAGVIRLVEWGIDQRMAADGLAVPRRSTGGAVILFLILAAITGAALHVGEHGQRDLADNLGIAPLGVEEFLGDKHTSEQERDLALTPGSHLTVTNPRGDITVTGQSTDGMMHLTLSKTIYGWSDAEVAQKAARLDPRVHTDDGGASIDIPTLDGARVDLTLTVPEQTPATLSATHGDLNVSDLRAPLTLTALHGDVELSRIGGTVAARLGNSGSSFSAHDVAGDVLVKGHADDLNMADISGAVTLQGEFFGDTHLEHLGGPLIFETNRTQFHAGRLDGEIDISPASSFTGSRLIGPTTLRSRSRTIELSGLTGDVNITDRDGTVNLNSLSPLGNVTVENRNGAVEVHLPYRPDMTLAAQTTDGNVTNNLELTSHKDGALTQLQGTLGNGHAQVNLKTTHADIEIEAGAPSAHHN